MIKMKIGFSDRLQRARDMYSILKGFEGYDPPRTTESLEGIQTFIDTLVLANKDVTDHNGAYRLSAGNRTQLFLTGDNSVIRLFSNIMLYVKARYGVKSTEYAILNTIMKRMRTSKLLKTTSVEATTESTEGVNEEQEQKSERSYTRSARSYGSLTQNFHDFITTVLKFDGYSPEFEEYKPESLSTLLDKINDANADVATKKSNLKVAQDSRKARFDELKERSKWIKSYVRYKYGTDSTEYNQIRSFRY
jgi:hypothetical protein